MCKIAVFTDATKLNLKDTVNKSGNILLKTETHGFGYAAQGENGVFGEKCVDRHFTSRLGKYNPNPLNIIKQKYSQFGKESKVNGSLIMHGRISTNDLGITNCHPMIRENHYLIHNGVVSDDTANYQRFTTNDSEDLLYRFIQGIKAVEENILGYYAFACIDPNGWLHIVKDDQADLNIAWLEKFDTYLIGTTPELIRQIAHALGTKSGPIDSIDHNKYMIFKGNDLTYVQDIEPAGYDYWHSKYAEDSLGKVIDKYSSTSSYNSKTELAQLPPAPIHGEVWDERDDYDRYNNKAFKNFSEEAFFSAIESLDDTAYIFDKHGNEITLKQFDELSFEEQKKCLIETNDGRIIEYIAAKAS